MSLWIEGEQQLLPLALLYAGGSISHLFLMRKRVCCILHLSEMINVLNPDEMNIQIWYGMMIYANLFLNNVM